MLYRGMDRAALDAAYNNTAAVGLAKREQYVAGWAARGAALRPRVSAKIDLRYGTAPRQRLDFFASGRPAAPTLVYIHGGYWQMNDKETSAFLGEELLPAGFNLVLVEYTLAPEARLDQITGEIRMAVAWVIDPRVGAGGRLAPRVRGRPLRGGPPDRGRRGRSPGRRRHRHQRHLRSRADPAQLSQRETAAGRSRGAPQ
jgi:hypothetical protein